jgi:putative acetyltransferase
VCSSMEIKVDDLMGEEIATFLEEHLNDMRSVSPPESKHALDLDALRKPDITFWTVWDHSSLVACGALKVLDTEHAEIKSMRTARICRGKGVASMLLCHLLNEAKLRQFKRVSLETGSMPFFQAARTLYAKHGFTSCGPFANYQEDPNSVFMSKVL